MSPELVCPESWYQVDRVCWFIGSQHGSPFSLPLVPLGLSGLPWFLFCSSQLSVVFSAPSQLPGSPHFSLWPLSSVTSGLQDFRPPFLSSLYVFSLEPTGPCSAYCRHCKIRHLSLLLVLNLLLIFMMIFKKTWFLPFCLILFVPPTPATFTHIYDFKTVLAPN